ncbi:hypothetical protein RSAG8_05531, partial [Rhizoctonia solani AG-8 WAC10335]
EELLTKIFMDVVFAGVWRSQGPPDRQPASMEQSLVRMWQRLSTLLAVCSAWKNIVLTHGAFWSTVTMYRTSRCYFGRTMAPELSIPRARGSALHLAGILEAEVQMKKIEEMASYIAGHTSQIHTINISAPVPSMGWLFKVLLELGAYPLLSELSLGQIDCTYDQAGMAPELAHVVQHHSDSWAPFTELLRSLSVLRIAGAGFGWRHMDFSTRLVELQLQQLVIGPSSTLARLLNSAPELRNLRIISVVTFPDPNEAKNTISLHNLQSLLLENLYFNTLEFLFKSIAPGSHRLKLHLTKRSRKRVLESVLAGLEARVVNMEDLYSILQLVSVNTLVLSYTSISPIGTQEMWLTGLELRGLLKSMPAIKILKMRSWCCDVQAGGALKRPQSTELGNGEQFPKFEQLYLSSTVILDEGIFKDVVASHSPQKMVFGGNLYRQGMMRAMHDGMARFPGFEENPPDWLRSNVPEFYLLENHADPPEFYSAVWRLW